jgi:RHS repeat-associated protein
MATPDGHEYRFAAPITTTYRVARLESIKDLDSNTITLAYNNASLLTKVSAPSGDDRYIYLNYYASLITKAQLKNSSTTLAEVSYAYDANLNLTSVTRADGSAIAYSYGVDSGATDSHYMAARTDPNGNQTSYTMDYAVCSLDSTTTKNASVRVSMTNPDGVTSAYERDNLASNYSTRNYSTKSSSSGTVLQRTNYADGTLGYFVGKMQYYSDPTNAASTKNATYEYANDRDLTKASSFTGDMYTTYAYTTKGKILSKSNACNATTSYEYGANGLDVTKATSPANVSADVSYDSSRHATKVVTGSISLNGYTIGYNSSGQVVQTTDPLGSSGSFSYDGVGNLTSITDANNITTTSYYDAKGRVTRQTDGNGNSSYYYYADGCASCSGSGRLTSIIDALGNETSYQYDSAGNKTKVADALLVETDYSFDDMNRLTRITSPSGSSNYTTYAYDLLGNNTKVIDYNGTVTNYKYDAFGHVTTKSIGSSSEDIIERTVYNADGQPYSVYDGMGHLVATYSYDKAGRVTLEGNEKWELTSYLYDDSGRLTLKGAFDGTYNPTEYFYNESTGLLTKVRYTNDSNVDEINFEYDSLARATKVTDWDGGNGYRTEYDAGGRLTKMRDYDDSTLTYAYDAAGNATSMTDWHGNATTYAYNKLNALTKMTAPGNRQWTWTYNVLGQPALLVNPNSALSWYWYDERNRLTNITQKTALLGDTLDSLTYGLDAQGNITKTTQTDGSVWNYTYDGRYRLVTAARNNMASSPTITATYRYAYDNADNLLTKVEPFKDDFNDGDYSGWTNGGGTWDASSHYLSKTSGAGLIYRANTDPSYDLWLSYYIDATPTSGYVFLRFVDWSNYLYLQFIAGGTYLMECVGGTTYTRASSATASNSVGVWYDLYVQITGTTVKASRAVRGSGVEMSQIINYTGVSTSNTAYFMLQASSACQYRFDNIRLASDSLSTATTFAYNNVNELTKSSVGGADTLYYYDISARQYSKNFQSGAHTATYTYRYDSKLCTASTTIPDESNSTLTYDGLGKLRSFTESGVVKKARWDRGWNMINLESSAGALEQSFYYHPQENARTPLGLINGATPSVGTPYYIFQDIIGSVRHVRDASQASFAQYEFDPYGGDYFINGIKPPFGFTGKRNMSDLGLTYFPKRMYSSGIARWLTRDPAEFVDGPNVYGYVASRPINAIDPLGDVMFDNLHISTADMLRLAQIAHDAAIAKIDKKEQACHDRKMKYRTWLLWGAQVDYDALIVAQLTVGLRAVGLITKTAEAMGATAEIAMEYGRVVDISYTVADTYGKLQHYDSAEALYQHLRRRVQEAYEKEDRLCTTEAEQARKIVGAQFFIGSANVQGCRGVPICCAQGCPPVDADGVVLFLCAMILVISGYRSRRKC